MTRTVRRPEREGDLIGLALAEPRNRPIARDSGALGDGGRSARRSSRRRGEGESLGFAGGRSSVFEGPGYAIYAPAESLCG